MRVVFGIGNPGPEYDGTRHNFGFRVVDALADRAHARFRGLFCLQALGAKTEIAGERVLFVKPLTYVNRCGPILETIRRRRGLGLDDLLVVVDDLALPLGRLRLRAKGSHGGHNGLKSLIAHLGSPDFPRLRIGIGDPGGQPVSDYVLETFAPAELPAVDRVLARTAEAVAAWVREGTEAAMPQVNRRDLDHGPDPA